MIAIVSSPDSMRKAMNYNEKKVDKNRAEFIHSNGYLKELAELNFYDKEEGLLRLMSRSEATSNCLHISLNFSVNDDLDRNKLIQITDDYMERIGFGDQPYLVYQHFDAAHPHVHVLTTNIKPDGKRIDTFRIGAGKSWTATRALEGIYGLTVATDQEMKESYTLKPVDLKRIVAGKSEVRSEINNILRTVPHKYAYTSLEEYNAILRQYNVFADRGSQNSRVFQSGGLLYTVLDDKCKPATKPIKASRFYPSPTMAFLQERFKQNAIRRLPFKKHIRQLIDAYFHSSNVSISGLVNDLSTKGIYTQLNINAQGFLYGVTFVDNIKKCAFIGSDLGKGYSASALQKRIEEKQAATEKLTPGNENLMAANKVPPSSDLGRLSSGHFAAKSFLPDESESFLDILLRSEYSYEPLPYQLRRTARKKRKRKN
ncbi:relaxase/mobilization nuclease domain-containing protein [Pedobacter paludis]|uniref:Relaxase n=1 Tax=Pedobacter paludis TaxID=2203212 RepID=A0A317F402_9SPHI|nr:relaxase/mobilization nuclease domain-containing protein [Pedobacter paludis]PWS32218.1 relaxase [Pedobacter paludis]